MWISIAKEGRKKDYTNSRPMVACLLLYTWPTAYRIRVEDLHCPTWYGVGVVRAVSQGNQTELLGGEGPRLFLFPGILFGNEKFLDGGRCCGEEAGEVLLRITIIGNPGQWNLGFRVFMRLARHADAPIRRPAYWQVTCSIPTHYYVLRTATEGGDDRGDSRDGVS